MRELQPGMEIKLITKSISIETYLTKNFFFLLIFLLEHFSFLCVKVLCFCPLSSFLFSSWASSDYLFNLINNAPNLALIKKCSRNLSQRESIISPSSSKWKANMKGWPVKNLSLKISISLSRANHHINQKKKRKTEIRNKFMNFLS